MTDEPTRDLRLARALDAVPVPDYEPGFWDRLEAQLVAAAPAPGSDAPASDDPDLVAPHVVLPTVVPLAARRGLAERRRSLLVLAAAAAVVIAVVAVSLRPGGGTAVRTAAGTPGTGAPTTAPASGSVDHGSTTSALLGQTLFGPGAALGTSSGVALAPSNADPTSPQGTFVAWVDAVHAGDTPQALALTGPRTARYEEALKVSEADEVTGWASAWGDWADAAQRRIDLVELGTVSGQRVVGIVLRRPATGAKYDDQYDALPMVQTADGWRVEPDGFDPTTEGRLEVVSPTPGQDGLQDLPSTGIVQVAATGSGNYVLSVDLAQGTTVPVARAVGGTITWNPPDAALVPGAHLLLVAHVSDTTIAIEADPFTVSG